MKEHQGLRRMFFLIFLRSVQREQTMGVFHWEIYSWFLCRESSNIICCYRYVFALTPPEVSHFSMVWTVVLGLQELVKHTTDASDKENLRKALDAMKVCLHVFIYQWLCCFSCVMRCVFVCVQDLAQCVNEVKRDNEIIKQITTFQMSIENLVRALWMLCPCQVSSLYSSQLFSALQTQSLALYGRPKIDGELKISSSEKKSKQDRCRACVSQ